MWSNVHDAVRIVGPCHSSEHASILSLKAQEFLVILHRTFNARRKSLLQLRQARQFEINEGRLPDFLNETKNIRNDPTWKGPPLSPGLVDRRVEITGPVDRKMIINALNSGANQFMADLEDSTSPTWANVLDGQVNLRDANNRTISFEGSNGKKYQLKDKIAVLLVRPRGWHMEEAHFEVDGEKISASLFDFGLYFFHNAHQTLRNGAGPYFYLPKMESHLEARLWNDVFNVAQDYIGMRRGTVRATVLIETILAAFEMEEIIYELRDHSAGLNCGRWDYIFSFIKKLSKHPRFVLPDRSQVTMTTPFMSAYVNLLIATCHKRGVHAMGGMAAQIPIKGNAKLNEEAMNKVKMDKLREANAGHDGTWVAHPDLIPIAKAVFDQVMPSPNQMHNVKKEASIKIKSSDLLSPVSAGSISVSGIVSNVHVALVYMEAWLRGVGCVPIHNLMEDAATAEISRVQLWQWIKHSVAALLGDSIGSPQIVVTFEYVKSVILSEVSSLKKNLESSKFEEAGNLLIKSLIAKECPEFLTLLCYDSITTAIKQDEEEANGNNCCNYKSAKL